MPPASMMRGHIAIVLSVRACVRASVRPSVRQSVRPYEIHIVNKSYAIAHKALILAWMLSVITLNILTSPNLILTLTLT